MTHNKDALIRALENYTPVDDNEKSMARRTLDFLRACDKAGKNAFCRTTLEGHITASAFVIDEEARECLLLHHAKLNIWVQPGGHCDGDDNIIAAAVREVEEETGLKNVKADPGIFNVDAHNIPARGHEPTHVHYDICFLVRTGKNEKTALSDESHDMRWIPFSAVASISDNASILRMVRKMQTLKTEAA